MLKKFLNLLRLYYIKKTNKLFPNPLVNKSLWNLLLENISAEKNTIIHDNGIWLPHNNTVCRLSQKYKIPYIVSPHGSLDPLSLRYSFLKKKLAMYLKNIIWCRLEL